MNIVWSSVAIALLVVAGGVAVAGGEPAVAELRLAEAATMAAAAGISAVSLLEVEAESLAAQAVAPID